jgi:putative peptidoglycan lipid II flippase
MSLGRAAGTVGGATLVSRIAGLLRDQLFAALLGVGLYSDAFVIAFRIPNLLRDLFAEGALSSAFVPTFTETEVKRSERDAWDLANLVIGVLLAVVGSLTLLGILFAPQVVAAIAPGFGAIEGKAELTVLLTRIMFPFLPLIALAALFMGMLNVKGRFAVPASAPVLFNLTAIAVGVGLYLAAVPPRAAVIGWSVGTLLGGLAQAGVQVPPLLRLGWRFRPTLAAWRRSEGLRQIGRLMLPAVIGLSATQINILVNSILASLLEQGSPTWLNFAFRLMQLPIGIFGVAIGVVTLPRVARDAANEAPGALRANLASALTLVLLLTVPAAAGLWLLGVPIVRLIYEHGAFTALDTTATAAAIAVYAIGLPAYAAVKVLAPAFYALKDARTPMVASLTAVGLNIAFNLAVYRSLGYRGLALGTSIAEIALVTILLVQFQRTKTGLPLGAIARSLGKILVATAAMAVAALVSFRALSGRLPGLTGSALETFGAILPAIAVYGLALRALGVDEASKVIAAVRRIAGR